MPPLLSAAFSILAVAAQDGGQSGGQSNGQDGGQASVQSLSVAGSETRSMMLMDLYELTVLDPDGRLTEADLSDTDTPKRIEIKVLYGGDVPDIPEGWSSELAPALPGEEWRDLREAYQGLTEGDEIVCEYRPGEGTRIEKNGKQVVGEPGYEATAAALDVWFGDTPVSEDIKSAFLDR